MDIPVPKIDDDEVLVEVKAIGVGIQDGYFFPKNIEFPYPIGMEGSGIINKVGKNVADFQEGDRVAFVGVLEPKGGAYAEYMILGKQSLIVPIPGEMSFIEAAAIPVKRHFLSGVNGGLQSVTVESNGILYSQAAGCQQYNGMFS